MRQPLPQPITLDFDQVYLVKPERGRVLLNVLSADEVRALLALLAVSAAPGVVQDSDPGPIGAFKFWVDTTGGPGRWTLKFRDEANTAWESVAPLVQNQTDGKHYRLTAETNDQDINEVFPEDSPVD